MTTDTDYTSSETEIEIAATDIVSLSPPEELLMLLKIPPLYRRYVKAALIAAHKAKEV